MKQGSLRLKFSIDLIVLVHVPLQDLVKWAKKPLESLTLERQALDFTGGDDVGSTHLAGEQCLLSEVGAWLVLHDLDLLAAWLGPGGDSCALVQQVELVALVSLADDVGSLAECLLSDSITEFTPLIWIH